MWLLLYDIKPSKEDPVLLLDGYYTPTQNTDIINMAHANVVSIVCLGPQ
jgi:hypothetical protein